MSPDRPCPSCGGPVQCGLACGTARCWCCELPHVMPMDATQSCLCRKCLEAAIAARLASGPQIALNSAAEAASPSDP